MAPVIGGVRKMDRGEVWTKRCQCGGYIPDEYVYCASCLISRHAAGMLPAVGGACAHEDAGYSARQVEIMLRRALNNTIVLMPGDKL